MNQASAASERCLQPTERIRHLIARRGARSRATDPHCDHATGSRSISSWLSQISLFSKKLFPVRSRKFLAEILGNFFASYWFVMSFRAVITHVRGQSSDFPC